MNLFSVKQPERTSLYFRSRYVYKLNSTPPVWLWWLCYKIQSYRPSHVAWLHPDFPQASVYISYEMWGFKKISFWPSIQHLLLSLHSNSSVKITGAAPWPETSHPGHHISRDNVHCSVKHDCLDAGVVQIVTMTVLSTSYNTLACVNNIGVHLSVELNGDGRVQRDPGVRPPTALLPG